MVLAPRMLIAGNWKMNLGLAEAEALAADLTSGEVPGTVDVAVCPPFPYLASIGGVLSGSRVELGAQDCHAAEAGAHTGDVAVGMLRDVGCRFVIVGHSERRVDHGETDAVVLAKAQAALSIGLVPIVCVGETEGERDAGQALAVVERQVRGSLPDGVDGTTAVVAYEPVWAIGTGRTPTPADVAEVHGHIRAVLADKSAAAAQIRVLYGGSVKPNNAQELMAVDNVDGALVGGASLKADDFLAICRARSQ